MEETIRHLVLTALDRFQEGSYKKAIMLLERCIKEIEKLK